MTSEEIESGRCYWIRVGDLPARRVIVDWYCPMECPQWYYCWDIESSGGMVLIASDFLRPCDHEVEKACLLRLDERLAGPSTTRQQAGVGTGS